MARGVRAPGVRERHSRSCRSLKEDGLDCNCTPTYEAQVWDGRAGKPIRRTFTNIGEAQTWVGDAKRAVKRGRNITQSKDSLETVCKAWLEDAKNGVVRARSGHEFKPAAVRGYATGLKRLYPKLGKEPLAEVSREDLQEIVEELTASGLKPSTVQVPITALKSVIRREIRMRRLTINPTVGLELPAITGGRNQVVTPAQAKLLLAALAEQDRPVWATALYAGLRRGELRALRGQAVDLEANELHVVAGWDAIEGEQATKGRERRRVILIPELRTILADHWIKSGRGGNDLLFGETPTEPFKPEALQKRADDAWKAAGLDRMTPHVGRHTFASMAIAAGVNIGTVSEMMGHASVKITWDRYHHLMPGTMDEAGRLLQAYVEAGSA